MRDLRTTVLAVVLWGAALLAPRLDGVIVPAGVACVVAAGLVAVMGRGGGRTGLAVVALLGCAAMTITVSGAQSGRATLAESDGRAVEVVVEVASSATVGTDGRLWFDATTRQAGAPGSTEPVSAPVRIGVDPHDGIDLGARLRVIGQGKATEPGERAGLVVFGTQVEVLSPPVGVFVVAAATRATFVERAQGMPSPGADLLPGLAVGDTRAVPNALDEAMLASGLSHLTAVSGANCAIVVAAVFWIAAGLGAGRTLRVVAALTALAAFVVLVTPEPSVIRASVMAALAMLALLLGRPSAGLSMLALAVCVLLIADPWLAASPGFALSAAATAALLLLSRPLTAGLRRWMPDALALALAVPLSAQLVCGPIVALFSPQQSIVGVLANLLAAPAAPLATVIGLLACLCAPLPPLADLFAAAAWLPSAWIAQTALTSAALPGATATVPPGPITALLVAVLGAAIGIVIAWPRVAGLRVAAVGVVVVTVGLFGARALLTGPLVEAAAPDGWSVAACDVGQGDAVIVRAGESTALIDTGVDVEALQDCLRATGTGPIDLLVLTHFDADHVGAVSAVEGRVGVVLHGPPGGGEDQALLRRLADAGAQVVEGAAGRTGRLGDARWRILWPTGSPGVEPGNDASLVLEMAGGGLPRLLLLGDLSAEPQRRLLAGHAIRGGYDVVKVAHHGSRDQEPALYEQADAAVALIGVGEDNRYGHPRAETLAVLRATGARVFRTDEDGLVLLGRVGEGLAIWTEHGGG